MIAAALAMIPHDRRWLALLVVINVAGSIYGFNWYAAQLAATPWYLWPVVPDSPLSSLMFGVYLALRSARRAVPLLAAVAQTATFKYGLWSVLVLGGYVLRTGDAHPELLLLLVTHAGMALEAYLLMKADPPPLRPLGVAFAWLLINDAFDYLRGTHPTVPDPAALPFIAVEAVGLTLASIALSRFAARGRSANDYT